MRKTALGFISAMEETRRAGVDRERIRKRIANHELKRLKERCNMCVNRPKETRGSSEAVATIDVEYSETDEEIDGHTPTSLTQSLCEKVAEGQGTTVVMTNKGAAELAVETTKPSSEVLIAANISTHDKRTRLAAQAVADIVFATKPPWVFPGRSQQHIEEAIIWELRKTYKRRLGVAFTSSFDNTMSYREASLVSSFPQLFRQDSESQRCQRWLKTRENILVKKAGGGGYL